MHEFYYYHGGTLLRVLFVLVAIGSGFGIGWLTTPQSKEFRRIALFVIVFVVLTTLGLATLFINNAIGWNAAFFLAIIGFIWGLGYWSLDKVGGFFKRPTTFGSSRWATVEDLLEKQVYGTDGIRVGKAFNEDGDVDWVTYKGDRHLLTVAPTRSGKGTTQIIPNLLTYEGSTLVIDPKGENAAMSAKRRQDMGHEVHIVDPWGITPIEGFEVSCFNPLDWLDTTDPDLPENAMLLASSIVVESNSQDKFWDEEAKALLQGLIMHVATDPQEDGHRHLGRVRELLVQSTSEMNAMFAKMAESFHPIVKSTGERSLQKEEKLFASVIASAQSHSHFLDSDRMNLSMRSSSFKFEDLKSKPMTIYLVLPADRLNTFGRWLRLLVQQAITVNARNIETKPEKPILFILDEFAALGKLTMVEQAFGLMAGYGMQLWGIVQDLNQLEKIYDKGWQSFVSNAGMINYFGSSDKMTAEYFSSLCGETTVWSLTNAISQSFSNSSGSGGGTSTNSDGTSDSATTSQRKLAFPDELMRLRANEQLVFLENMHPLRADKVRWFDDPELKDLGVNLEG